MSTFLLECPETGNKLWQFYILFSTVSKIVCQIVLNILACKALAMGLVVKIGAFKVHIISVRIRIKTIIANGTRSSSYLELICIIYPQKE